MINKYIIDNNLLWRKIITNKNLLLKNKLNIKLLTFIILIKKRKMPSG